MVTCIADTKAQLSSLPFAFADTRPHFSGLHFDIAYCTAPIFMVTFCSCRYQAPGSFDEFWKDVVTKDRLQADRKRKGSRPEVDTKVSQGQGQNNRNKGQQKKQNVGKAVSEKKTEKGKKEQMELRT
ncbi:hypothetical protein DPMN_059680 [Dreissena polymorpha]|uniref:Uncharacterized protein n=1 Tax=Dreissena polymorpha TaxID=45954 RepID=A0A9D4HHG7_DREPO|nr:hypothetical protein DPMN_059680 [Dreissena polymorpha]